MRPLFAVRIFRIRLSVVLILLFALKVSAAMVSDDVKKTPTAESQSVPALANQNRVVILTDIGADPDDTMSLVRLLTYSNEIDIRGIIATTSTFQKTRIEPESIQRVLEAYREARVHLLQHEPGYPSFETLSSRLSHGLAVYGMEGVGEGKDSPGSELIVAELNRPDPRPLWISVWGGTNTLAQALWKIRKTRSASDAEVLYRKLRVYTISDQDDTGPWIRRNFPSIFYICSPGSFIHATWLGMGVPFPGSNKDVISTEWLARNIQEGHGPLGAVYPDVAYMMEGDTPSYLSLIPNGLNDPEHPNYGGWGGRYELYTSEFTEKDWHPSGQYTVRPEPETHPIWTNAEDTFSYPAHGSLFDDHAKEEPAFKSAQVTIWRWREEVQNDFAARMCWATKPYSACNHPPVPVLAVPDELTVTSGEQFYLDATGSHDPDGDSLSFYWFQYREAGDYHGNVDFRPFAQNLKRLPVTAPKVDAPVTVHFILKVTDKGTPALTRYRRVIVHLRPAS